MLTSQLEDGCWKSLTYTTHIYSGVTNNQFNRYCYYCIIIIYNYLLFIKSDEESAGVEGSSARLSFAVIVPITELLL